MAQEPSQPKQEGLRQNNLYQIEPPVSSIVQEKTTFSTAKAKAIQKKEVPAKKKK